MSAQVSDVRTSRRPSLCQESWDQAEQLLRARANAGNWVAAWQLAELREERGDLDALRALADVGDAYAAQRLADLLAKHGDLDQAEQLLRAPADAGDGNVRQLAELLTQQGRREEADRLRRFGLAPDGSTAGGRRMVGAVCRLYQR